MDFNIHSTFSFWNALAEIKFGDTYPHTQKFDKTTQWKMEYIVVVGQATDWQKKMVDFRKVEKQIESTRLPILNCTFWNDW